MSELSALPTSSINLSMRKRKVLDKISEEFRQKDQIFQKRAEKIKEQNQAFSNLIGITRNTIDSGFSAKSFRQTTQHAYTSGLLHKAWIYLNGVKLYPDFIDFQAEQRFSGDKGEVLGENISYLHRLIRNKGKYSQAARESQKDLIRGEGWMLRKYILNDSGVPIRIGYEHVPWKEMRQGYGYTSDTRLAFYTEGSLAKNFGADILKKVTYGCFLNHRESDGLSPEIIQKEKLIGVVHHVDPVSKEEYLILGGNAYFLKDLTDKDYPYVDQEGIGFSPYQKRIFYDAFQDEWHSWGVIDILYGLARLETILGNATARRAIDEADAFRVIYSNNPQEAEAKYKEWDAERRLSGRTKPFFVSDSNTGVRMTPANVSHGNTNPNFSFWKELIIDMATFLTDINFRALVEFAPTAYQDQQRSSMEDRVNLQVIAKNADSDKNFAIQDLLLLKQTSSKFHKEKFLLRRSIEDFSPKDNPDDYRLPHGEFVPKETTVGKFIDSIEDFDYDITPRLEGAFEDKTMKEVFNMKQDIMLMPPGTKAQQKLLTLYAKTAHPQARFEADDFITPASSPAGMGSSTPEETNLNLQ